MSEAEAHLVRDDGTPVGSVTMQEVGKDLVAVNIKIEGQNPVSVLFTTDPR